MGVFWNTWWVLSSSYLHSIHNHKMTMKVNEHYEVKRESQAARATFRTLKDNKTACAGIP